MFNFSKYRHKHWAVALLGVLAISSVLLTGYTYTRNTVSDRPDSLDLGPFVEAGFPYITTSVDARKLGPGFPTDNIAARTLALQLGDSAYACFDTDLLRWSVAWTGKFLPMVMMAQVSYKDFFNKNNKLTTVPGVPRIATGAYAGWTTGKPVFRTSNSSDGPTWRPLPADQARWNGVYVFENRVILDYSVGKAHIYEMPGSTKFGNEVAFTRNIQAENVSQELYLTAAEIVNATSSEVKGGIAYIFQGAGKDTVTAIGILGKAKWQVNVEVGKYLTVKLPASSKREEATVAVWRGPVSQKRAFEKFCRSKSTSLPDFKKGGPGLWKQTVVTQGQLSPDTAAFVTDQLTLPLRNPWKRNVRVADIAFFKDGKAAAVTFEGDVWMIDGIDRNLQNLKWKRFASGLHEPMSVEIVQDTVYVFGREGIVRLHDLNRDGVADYYENFSNVMAQSAESREWAADLVTAPDGSFYIAKGGSQSNGPAVTPATKGKGFRIGSDENGAVLKISKDGRQAEVIATGLRGPYLGIHPIKGILTASDQQGNFVPSTPIFVIQKGDYFGVEPTLHRKDNPPVTPPLTWIPHSVDRSAISQAWITGDKMGPLNGNLIHFSFGRPGLFRVLIDSTTTPIQGGVSVINANYPAPTSKGAENPADGQLYVTGFNLWGSSSNGISALLRLRYTGKSSYLPNHFRAGKQGIILNFDSPLDKTVATDPKNFEVKRWNYKRTEEYGSGHFKLDGSTGEETLPVVGSYLSENGKKLLLLVPEMTEIMQMEVTYHLKAADGKKFDDQFWFTINKSQELDLKKEGFNNVDLALLTAKRSEQAVAEAPASAEKGREVFQKMACAGCHSEGTRTKGMYGPPFQNLYKSERVFEDGSKLTADESYIRESILTPSKHIVKGYNEEMPSFVGVLSDNDIESVILFIKSLSGK